MTEQDLRFYLMDEAEYSEDEVERMEGYELVEAWLYYNGIIGFTQDIIDVVKAANV